jgi:hypothetical protein
MVWGGVGTHAGDNAPHHTLGKSDSLGHTYWTEFGSAS